MREFVILTVSISFQFRIFLRLSKQNKIWQHSGPKYFTLMYLSELKMFHDSDSQQHDDPKNYLDNNVSSPAILSTCPILTLQICAINFPRPLTLLRAGMQIDPIADDLDIDCNFSFASKK